MQMESLNIKGVRAPKINWHSIKIPINVFKTISAIFGTRQADRKIQMGEELPKHSKDNYE